VDVARQFDAPLGADGLDVVDDGQGSRVFRASERQHPCCGSRRTARSSPTIPLMRWRSGASAPR